MVESYETRLLRAEFPALQTGTFFCQKPRSFQFTAGQFMDVTLPSPGLPETERSHTFSICSAPYEDWLAFTTRLRESAFKQALRLLKPDEALELEGPYGSFVVPENHTGPIVFLVGGVGITPAISIIKQAAHDSRLNQYFLFYSNRSRAEAPFLDELEHLQAEHPGFHLIATMTADSSWAGIQERISLDLIARYLDPAGATFFVSGPPTMAKAMRDLLLGRGIAGNQIKYEAFSGY